MHLTRVQKRILHAILERSDLEIYSLFKLATELDIDYRHARWAVHDLARQGLVTVKRPLGRELRISVFHQCDLQNGGSSNMKLPESLQNLVGGNGYKRPELSEAEKEALSRVARRLNAINDHTLRLSYFAALVYENARLLAECNDHRSVRGIDPLTVYDPNKFGKNER